MYILYISLFVKLCCSGVYSWSLAEMFRTGDFHDDFPNKKSSKALESLKLNLVNNYFTYFLLLRWFVFITKKEAEVGNKGASVTQTSSSLMINFKTIQQQ